MATVVRKHPRRVLAARILREVREHPANRDHPNRAVARATGWQVRKRVGRGDVYISAYGLDLVLPRSSGSLSNFFYFGERFEWNTINFVERYLRPEDVDRCSCQCRNVCVRRNAPNRGLRLCRLP